MPEVSHRIQKLRNARLCAVQSIYMFEMTDFSFEEILNGFINGDLGQEILEEDGGEERFIAIVPPDEKLLSTIVCKYSENTGHIDEVITSSLSDKWVDERIELVLRSILRAGVTEMIYCVETDVATIIDEYVALAGSFYDDTEPKLVHAILHKVGNTLR